MLHRTHLPLLSACIALLLSNSANAGAKEECEDWARSDNISAMLWDRYVDSCIISLQGEEVDESGGVEDAPTPAPLKPHKREPAVDKSY
ncbi:MAG: hypothetical protein ACSHXK_06400 [Oceanococcus sp.]